MKTYFEDNFFNIGNIICSIILFTIFITDCITTIKGLSFGLYESNPFMRHVIELSPILFIIIKIIGAIIVLLLIKYSYNILNTMPKTKKYSDILSYIVFALPSGITLACIINNFIYISHYL
jgi:hypothetical protein